MAIKIFHTRRQRHNTYFMLLIVPVLLLLGVLVFAITGIFEVPLGLVVLSFLAVITAMFRDASAKVSYEIGNGLFVLRRAEEETAIPMEDVLDVSLIDRTSARAFVKGVLLQNDGFQGEALRERMRDITRYCTVDIGLTSFTLGMGRYIIDRMPHARKDLVLLRLRDGRNLLLSPVYNQDLIGAVTKAQGH